MDKRRGVPVCRSVMGKRRGNCRREGGTEGVGELSR